MSARWWLACRWSGKEGPWAKLDDIVAGVDRESKFTTQKVTDVSLLGPDWHAIVTVLQPKVFADLMHTRPDGTVEVDIRGQHFSMATHVGNVRVWADPIETKVAQGPAVASVMQPAPHPLRPGAPPVVKALMPKKDDWFPDRCPRCGASAYLGAGVYAECSVPSCK